MAIWFFFATASVAIVASAVAFYWTYLLVKRRSAVKDYLKLTGYCACVAFLWAKAVVLWGASAPTP